MSELSFRTHRPRHGATRNVTRTRMERIGLATLPATVGLLVGMLMTLAVASAMPIVVPFIH